MFVKHNTNLLQAPTEGHAAEFIIPSAPNLLVSMMWKVQACVVLKAV
jgi:hypothetical protein